MKRSELPVLIAIFLDLVGFGMAFPDVQLRAESYGASGILIGAILASLFAVQFVASPKWGLLSDRIGRRPVAVICTALSSASMLVYALSTNLWGILLSRVLAGLAAANVVVIQAYLADTSTEVERGPAMGRIGAAISVGLIGGPVLGGQLSQLGGSQLLGYVAAAFSGIAAICLFIGMKGIPPKEARSPGSRSIVDLSLIKSDRGFRALILLAAVSWFALACLEGTFGRLMEQRFTFPMSDLGLSFTKPQGVSGAVFGLESLVAFAVQGLLYVWISKRIQPSGLLRIGFFLQAIGLVMTPFVPSLGFILMFSSLYSIGTSIANPTLNTVCSNRVDENRQGELFGLLQASRSIGFLLGPIIGGALFDWHAAAPYVLAGGVSMAALLLVPVRYADTSREGVKEEGEST
ncbi:MAG TPA: MFS transporter [Fimbriimonadaceae bacterium]|nr:MFS transporter [Fimbriimonadaceae bacterium]